MIDFIKAAAESDNPESYDPEYERLCLNVQRLYAANKLQETLPVNQMPQVVVALKDYLSKSSKSNWDNFYPYEACYQLIWHCAQNMSYPDFYAA